MKSDKKIFISAGCSFSQVPNADKTWPAHVSDRVEFEKVVHTGLGAAGNGVISRLLIYSVLDALNEGYEAKDILVGVMWSGRERMNIYSRDPNFPHNKIPVTDTEHKNYQNPTWLRDDMPYQYLLNVSWEDRSSETYYKYFHDDAGSLLMTLEHVLRVQWFLESRGIDYFMLEYSRDCIREDTEELIAAPDLLPLYQQIDFTKWPCNVNMTHWVEQENIPYARPNDNHPSTDAHRQFVYTFIIPYLKKQNIVH